MAESSHSPEASERHLSKESDQERYDRIVHRARTWAEREGGDPYRYDSSDWRWHFMTMYGSVIGPALHVSGFENAPLPKQPGLFARLRGDKPVQISDNRESFVHEWTISWGARPENQYIVYNKIPHERPEGLEGKTPAVEGGWFSASGEEPNDWKFPRAEGFKEVNVFDETEKMLDVLEKSRVHEQGVHGRPKA